MEQGEYRFSPRVVDLVSLVESAARDVRAYADTKRVRLETRVEGAAPAPERRAYLGPPASRSDFSRLGLVSMDYTIAGDMGKNRIDVGVMIDKGGVVRGIHRIPQYRGG